MRQALNTVKTATTDQTQQLAVLREVATYLSQADTTRCPAHFSQPIYAIVSRITGVADPFVELKRKTNALALAILPEIRDRVMHSRNPLGKALHAAAAGNVIDAGVTMNFDVDEDMKDLLREPFAIDDLPLFRSRLTRGATLLYIADNAGEIVFDTLAIDRIQRLGVTVTVAVKSGPIINDATLEDARIAGLQCAVMETGSAAIGVDWSHASSELRAAFDTADLVLAKGHGHFETLFAETHPGLFFLLKAKCSVVAHALKCHTGSLVFVHASRLHA